MRTKTIPMKDAELPNMIGMIVTENGEQFAIVEDEPTALSRRTALLREAADLLRRTHVAMPACNPIGVDADDLAARIREEIGE